MILTNQYDLLNRLTNRSSAGGYAIAWTYTRSGQRQSMTDLSGTTTYGYDLRDRLLTRHAPIANYFATIFYGYDQNGSVTNLSTSTGGTKLWYQYDALNRLTNVRFIYHLFVGAPSDKMVSLETFSTTGGPDEGSSYFLPGNNNRPMGRFHFFINY